MNSAGVGPRDRKYDMELAETGRSVHQNRNGPNIFLSNFATNMHQKATLRYHRIDGNEHRAKLVTICDPATCHRGCTRRQQRYQAPPSGNEDSRVGGGSLVIPRRRPSGNKLYVWQESPSRPRPCWYPKVSKPPERTETVRVTEIW